MEMAKPWVAAQTGFSSSRSLQTEAPENEELLSLRPTRDFVEHFGQHTSFHRRKILRDSKGETHPRHRLLKDPLGLVDPYCEICRIVQSLLQARCPVLLHPAWAGLPGSDHRVGSAYTDVPILHCLDVCLANHGGQHCGNSNSDPHASAPVLWLKVVARTASGKGGEIATEAKEEIQSTR